MTNYEVLQRPILTEKSNDLMAQGKYTFVVAKRATKPEIRRAVEEIFKVKVDDVHTMNYRGKFRRQGKTHGYKPDWKKAVIKVAQGQTIKLFEGV